MARPNVTRYKVINKDKYIGASEPYSRSSWEMTVMRMFDKIAGTPGSNLFWGSECVTISYFNPLTRKWASYLPDFLVIYKDKNNVQHINLLEIKPVKDILEQNTSKNISEYQKCTMAVNAAKFTAAQKYCASRGWTFRIVTEKELFKTK